MRPERARACVTLSTALAGGMAMLTGLSSAAAHPEWSPIRVNRYTKLVVAEQNTTHLVYTILYGDGPGFAARKSADLDANGRLDERERKLLGARSAAAVAVGLRVTVDGAPLPLVPTAIDVGLAGDTVAPQPFSVDLTYPVTLGAGAHSLVLDDRVEVPSEGDSEIVVEVGPFAELLASHRGPATGRPVIGPTSSATVEKTFTFRGPRFSVLEDRRVGINLRLASASAFTKARSLAPLVAGGTALVLASFGVAARVWRRRRGR